MPETSRSALTRIAMSCEFEPDRRADDQRHGHGARVHDEQVLQAEDHQLCGGEHLVDRVHPCLGLGGGVCAFDRLTQRHVTSSRVVIR